MVEFSKKVQYLCWVPFGASIYLIMMRTLALFAALLLAGCASAFQLKSAFSTGSPIRHAATSRPINSCSVKAAPVAMLGPVQGQSLQRSDRTRLGVTAGFKFSMPKFTR